MSSTWNPPTREDIKKVERAIADAYDEALDVGCMEHGGFGVLAEAAINALTGGKGASENG